MAHDGAERDAQQEGEPEERTPSPANTARPTPRGPFTLASLLDLDEDELAQPLSQIAPPEHRWEQLSLRVAPETGEAVSSALRSGAPTDTPVTDRELIPGLDAPGAVEVPVYLAGRALDELLAGSASAPDVEAPGMLEHAEWRVENVRETKRHPRHTRSAAPLHSPMRSVRTLTALLVAPGELTAAQLAGQTRRYVGPAVLSTLALILFAVISLVAGLRPRPDRSLGIGSERTAEIVMGVVDRLPMETAHPDSPGVLREVSDGVAFVPVIWLPLAAMLVLAVVAGLRAPERRDGEAATIFTAHAMCWFVLWWGLGVPLLLLLLRLGFEATAASSGVQQVRYLASGGLAGVPALWNDARAFVATGAFHSALLALGFVPWVSIAWHRTFGAEWAKAITAALIVAAVPVLLLVPFA